MFGFNAGTKLYGSVPFYPKIIELKVSNTKRIKTAIKSYSSVGNKFKSRFAHVHTGKGVMWPAGILGATAELMGIISNTMVNPIGGWPGEAALFELYTELEKPQGWQKSQNENKCEVPEVGEGKRLWSKTEHPKSKPCHADVENGSTLTVRILKHWTPKLQGKNSLRVCNYMWIKQWEKLWFKENTKSLLQNTTSLSQEPFLLDLKYFSWIFQTLPHVQRTERNYHTGSDSRIISTNATCLSKQTVPDLHRKGRTNSITANWPEKKRFFWNPLKRWRGHILGDKCSQILVDHYQVTKVLAWIRHTPASTVWQVILQPDANGMKNIWIILHLLGSFLHWICLHSFLCL